MGGRGSSLSRIGKGNVEWPSLNDWTIGGEAEFHIGDLSMRTLVTCVVALGAFALLTVTGSFGADEKPKYSIKEVMKECQKSGLCGKVAGGKASKEEVAKLVDYYSSLPGNKPPKGDAKAWKETTEAMLAAAKACAKDENDKKAQAELKKLAGNCGGCHKMFK